jgi:hypothetical protein
MVSKLLNETESSVLGPSLQEMDGAEFEIKNEIIFEFEIILSSVLSGGSRKNKD